MEGGSRPLGAGADPGWCMDMFLHHPGKAQIVQGHSSAGMQARCRASGQERGQFASLASLVLEHWTGPSPSLIPVLDWPCTIRALPGRCKGMSLHRPRCAPAPMGQDSHMTRPSCKKCVESLCKLSVLKSHLLTTKSQTLRELAQL